MVEEEEVGGMEECRCREGGLVGGEDEWVRGDKSESWGVAPAFRC